MHNIYLGCKQPETYWIKEEIKKLKPKNKAFKGGWIFDHTLRCWHLCLADRFVTKTFRDQIEAFAAKHQLHVEILEDVQTRPKSIRDYNNEEEFFDDFHKRNQPK